MSIMLIFSHQENLLTCFKKIWFITHGQLQDNKEGVHCFIAYCVLLIN